MAEIAELPYFELIVNKQGDIENAAAREQAVRAITQGNDVTDVFVMSHGWNNSNAEAKDLYDNFFATLREALKSGKHGLSQRKFAVVGVFWPSKKFTESSLIPGGAAELSDPNQLTRRQFDALEDAFDNPDAPALINKAKALLPNLERSAAAQTEFVNILRQLPTCMPPDGEDASEEFFRLSGQEVMDRFSAPFVLSPTKSTSRGGAARMHSADAAAGIGSILSGMGNAALNLLNYTTYYQMKERSGLVGRGAVADLLRDLSARNLHLIGHSFGARVVTSAALGPNDRAPASIATMTLLQGAFSHNGFALKYDGTKDGFFRRVVGEGRIAGPLLITHSNQDKAVGIAYPLASRLAGQAAAAIGDANDLYGGLGRNGAQRTPESIQVTLNASIDGNSLTPGKPYNLNGDALIAGHSDIDKKPEIANALLWAISKT